MKFSLQLGSFSLGNVGTAAINAFSPTNFIPVDGFGDVIYYNLSNEKEFLYAYNLCSPLKSIIAKRAKAFNNGKLELIKKDGNYAKGAYPDSIKKLYDQPNALQSGKQFFSQQNHYIDIFGYCPVLKVRPVGFADEITSLWNIPPYLINDLDFTGKWLKQNSILDIYKKLTLRWNGDVEELDLKDIYFVLDDGIGTDLDCNLTIPDSRMVGSEYQISNIIAAYKSRNTLITKRGAIGILTNDGKDQAGTIPLPSDEKDAVQADFRQYGLTGQPKQVIITDAALKWQQMGFATKDLLLFEEIEDDVNMLCDTYGYPVELMARSKGQTFENKKQAKKDLYRSTIIPEAESRIQQNSKGIIDPGKGITMMMDYSEIDVIQEEAKERADARKALNDALAVEFESGLITKNMWLIELGRDTIDLPEFNEYKKQQTNEPITQQD
ncbi:MAG: phage portal protein [Bacteroidota bacterium]